MSSPLSTPFPSYNPEWYSCLQVASSRGRIMQQSFASTRNRNSNAYQLLSSVGFMGVLDYPALRGHKSQEIKSRGQELLGMSQGFIRLWLESLCHVVEF
jgi:hypothetical protein